MRTSPATIRHSLANCSAALQIERPSGRALISSASAIKPDASPIHAHSEVAPIKRQFEAAVLLMSYDIIRFPDARQLEIFEVNSDSTHGAILTCKTR